MAGRGIWVLVAAVMAGACATHQAADPKEFLDSQTGATVTVAHETLEFGVEHDLRYSNMAGVVNLTAASVDASGATRLYLVAYIWGVDPGADASGAGAIDLNIDGHEVMLRPVQPFPEDLQDRHRMRAPRGGDSRQYAYAADPALLQSIAASHDLTLTLPGVRTQDITKDDLYVLWADKRGVLRSFVQDVAVR